MGISKDNSHFPDWGGVCLCGCREQTGLSKIDKETLAVVGTVPYVSHSHLAIPLRLEWFQGTWIVLPPGYERQRVCEALDGRAAEGPSTTEL